MRTGLGVGLLLFPLMAIADPTLDAAKLMIPNSICQGLLSDGEIAARLKTMQINYEKCLTLIPPLAEECQRVLQHEYSDSMDIQAKKAWGNKYGQCIGKTFSEKYLSASSSN